MLLFTYGTLLRGFGNYDRFLTESKFVGLGQTHPDYTMVSLGGFPGILEGGNTSIKGEVFEVSPATRDRLDQLEGHPNFYKRTSISLVDGSKVEVYILQPVPHLKKSPVVESGDWREFREVEIQ